MADKVYKKIEVTGCSTVSFEKAIEVALAKAGGSVRGISWFEVKELRGAPAGGATFAPSKRPTMGAGSRWLSRP